MLKTIVLLGLWLSIIGIAHAQTKEKPAVSPDDQIFELSPGTTVARFWVDLGKGNLLRLELSRRDDLARFENIDSLLLTFLADMKAFRDSLGDPLTGKRIDYLMDTTGVKKMRIRQTRLTGNTYLLEGGEPALLRVQQDTISYSCLHQPTGSRERKPPNQSMIVWDFSSTATTTSPIISRRDSTQNCDPWRQTGRCGWTG